LSGAYTVGEAYEAMPAPALNRPVDQSDQKPPHNFDFSQWQVGTNGVFRPAAKTVPSLEPGVYAVEADSFGPLLRRKDVLCDQIVDLPDVATNRVLASMKKFWASRERYTNHGLIYKRGVMMYGPPGSGKTVTSHLLMRELISLGGIVLLMSSHPDLVAEMLQVVRRLEPDRPLIVVMEDIDETIRNYGERSILMMLDGETQIDNIVYIATTNYPDQLGARIVNRPSRFDERIFVGMPSLQARVTYLRSVAGVLPEAEIERWAADTDGLSVAHLRELVAAVLCLDQQYEDVLERLRQMEERPKEVDGFASKPLGLLKVGNRAVGKR
jgi:SpoVK/Ycf46/Vps4 family AAA+-type ATPase